MYASQAFVPQFIRQASHPLVANVLAVLSGVMLLSLLAQIVVPLPWTPVPVTGQTFGVACIALLWGGKRGATILALYLLIGYLGAPVFAMGRAGLAMGPTLGYLMGMFLASYVMGSLADKGFAKGFKSSLAVAYLGSFITFSCGVFVLSFYLPIEALFVAGVAPFLIGDLVKNTLAAYICSRA